MIDSIDPGLQRNHERMAVLMRMGMASSAGLLDDRNSPAFRAVRLKKSEMILSRTLSST
jgi:hypothetical protein